MRPWCYYLLKNMMCLRFIHVVWYQGEVWQAVAEGDFPNSKTCFWRTFVTHTSLSAILFTSSSPETQQYEHLTQDKKSSLQISLPGRCSELPGHFMKQQPSGFFNIFTKLPESARGAFWPIQKRTFQGQFSAGNARICLSIFINPKLRRIDLVFSLSPEKMSLVVFLWTFI